jgi:transcriptional regulator with XRE-family HTH domain
MTKLKLVNTTSKRSILRASDSYLFHDKHPLIDVLRTKMRDEGVTYEELHNKTGVSIGTLVRWFDGTTKNPHSVTLNQVASYFGLRLSWSEVERSDRDRRSWLDWKASKDATWKEWFGK